MMTGPDHSASTPGGKCFSTGSGWAVGAGVLPPIEESMTALKAAGPIPNHPAFNPAYPRQYWATVATRAKAIAFGGLLDGIPPQHWSTTSMLIIEPHTPVIVLVYRDADVSLANQAGDGPADLAGEWPTIGKAMMQSVEDAGDDLASRIRSVAEHFENTSLRSYTMSAEMEIGYLSPDQRPGFLRGKARAIANSRAEDILERFQAAPLEVSPMAAAAKTSRVCRWASYREGQTDRVNEWPSTVLGAEI